MNGVSESQRASARHRRAVLALIVGLLFCVPFLSGYTGTCLQRMHSVHPTTVACPHCPAEFVALATGDARTKLRSPRDPGGGTGSGMVVALGSSDWSTIEQCVPEAQYNPPTDPRVFEGGTRTCVDQPVPYTCKCWYDLRPLGTYLDAYVAQLTAGGEELNPLIQLAPIFTSELRLPPYLIDKPLDSEDVVIGYLLLWDRVSRVLADPKFDGANFVISLGNEVNFYLNNPTHHPGAHPLSNPIPEPNAAFAKWFEYLALYQTLAPYVRDTQVGKENACFGENPPSGCGDTEGLVHFRREVVATTTWWGHCGLGHATEALCNNVQTGLGPVDFLDFNRSLIDTGDAAAFTYYPPHEFIDFFLGSPPDEQAAVSFLVTWDVTQMAQAAEAAGDKLVYVQEAGLPTSPLEQGFNGQTEGATMLDRQTLFVDAFFDAWANQPEARLLLRGGSVFALHDFSTQTANSIGWLPCDPQNDSCPLFHPNLVCDEGYCRGDNCSNDGQCLPELGFVCCQNGDHCGTTGHCVMQSDCDSFLPFDPNQLCPMGTDAECGSGQVCSSGHRCVDAVYRARLCSLGLHDEHGVEKVGWTDAFYPQSVAFDPSAACACDDPEATYPCASSNCRSGTCNEISAGGVCEPE